MHPEYEQNKDKHILRLVVKLQNIKINIKAIRQHLFYNRIKLKL